jgi:hypothetical protein
VELKIERDFPSAIELEKEIAIVQLAIRNTRKSVRLHQNKKKLKSLDKKLAIKIYHHNKYHMLEYLDYIVSENMKSHLENLELAEIGSLPWRE